MGVTKPNETLKIRSTTGAGLFGQIYVEKVLHVLTGVSSPRNENRIQPVQACAAVHRGMHLLTQCPWHLAALQMALHASAYAATSCPRYPVLSCVLFLFFFFNPVLSVECQMFGNQSSCRNTLVQTFPHAWLYLYFSCIVVNPSWFVPVIASVMCLKTE